MSKTRLLGAAINDLDGATAVRTFARVIKSIVAVGIALPLLVSNAQASEWTQQQYDDAIAFAKGTANDPKVASQNRSDAQEVLVALQNKQNSLARRTAMAVV